MPDDPRTLPRDQLIPWPGLNPRRMFETSDLEELRESLEADGMIEPVGVTLQEEPPHWIFAGERRWRAAEGVLEELPVIVRDIDEATARRLALTENIQRSDLTAVEEAEGIEKYLEASGSTQKAFAEQLGKTQSWISNRLRLLRLTTELRELIQAGRLSASQARDLILPFSKLDEWPELAGKVGKKLAKIDDELDDETVRRAVSDVAVPMSGWLDRRIHGHEDAIAGLEAFLHLEPKHWKTAPKGTLVQYAYGPYQGGVTSTRCFDPEWWLHAMQKEQRRRDKKAERMRLAREDTEPPGPDLEWSADRGPIPGDHFIPHGQRYPVFELQNPMTRQSHQDPLLPIGPIRGEDNPELYDRGWRILVDPSLIPEECLVLQEGASYRSPAVLCTKGDVYEEAMEKLERTRDELYEDRIRRAAETDLERARQLKMSDLPAIVALGRMMHEEAGYVDELAAELGLELPERGDWPDTDWWHPWRVAAARDTWFEYEWLAQIPSPQLTSLVELAVERLLDRGAPFKPREGHGLATGEQLRRSINFELRCTYRRELEKKLPFPLPTHETEDEDDEE